MEIKPRCPQAVHSSGGLVPEMPSVAPSGSGTMGPLAAQVHAASVMAHAKQMPVSLFINAKTLFGFRLVW